MMYVKNCGLLLLVAVLSACSGTGGGQSKALANTYDADGNPDIICKKVPKLGSRFKETVCTTAEYRAEQERLGTNSIDKFTAKAKMGGVRAN